MSTPDIQHMIRVVAEKFEVKGWKPGQMCKAEKFPAVVPPHSVTEIGCDKCGGKIRFEPSDSLEPMLTVPLEHEIPPPDLLSPDGAWALLVALLNSETVSDDMKYAITHDLARPKNRAGHLPLALLAAAFQLTEEGRK